MKLKYEKRSINWKNKIIVGICENCGRNIDIPIENIVIKRHFPYELKEAIQCTKCGEYHNLITENSQPDVSFNKPNKPTENAALKCPRCGSTQLHAGDKGFSLGKAAAGGILIGPIGLLGGLLGSKKTMITCLQCGHNWQAGK